MRAKFSHEETDMVNEIFPLIAHRKCAYQVIVPWHNKKGMNTISWYNKRVNDQMMGGYVGTNVVPQIGRG